MKKFFQAMLQASEGLALRVHEPKWCPIEDTRTGTYLQKLREVMQLKPLMVKVLNFAQSS